MVPSQSVTARGRQVSVSAARQPDQPHTLVGASTERLIPRLKMRIGVGRESADHVTTREKISSEERDGRKSHFKS